MTFSQAAKQEIMRIRPEKHCCMLSELSALTQSLGSLGLIGGGRYKVTYHVESSDLAKRIFGLLLMGLQITATMEYGYLPRFGGRRVCEMTVSGQDARKLLTALHMMRSSEGNDIFKGVPRAAIVRKCCRQAFLRGMFLGNGALADPKDGYRMEFITAGEDRADLLLRVLERNGVQGMKTQRRGQTVVYVKKGDDVVTLLAAVGAHTSLMEMENIRIRRSALGQVNRALNCDSANMRKQTDTGRSQAESIMDYSRKNGLGALDEPLYELARARMMNPDISLEQLGALLEPPATKSAVNYRMRKLMKLINDKNDPTPQ